jgi:hypothetical protein
MRIAGDVDLQQEADEKLATQDPVASTDPSSNSPATSDSTQLSAVACAVSNLSTISPSARLSSASCFIFNFTHARSIIGRIKRRRPSGKTAPSTPFLFHLNHRSPLNSRHRCNVLTHVISIFMAVLSIFGPPRIFSPSWPPSTGTEDATIQ